MLGWRVNERKNAFKQRDLMDVLLAKEIHPLTHRYIALVPQLEQQLGCQGLCNRSPEAMASEHYLQAGSCRQLQAIAGGLQAVANGCRAKARDM